MKKENEALLKKLALAEKMLAKSTGHKAMIKQIDKQKKTTREALSYVADLKRDRSMFQLDSMSQIDVQDLSISDIDETKVQDRRAKLMDLI